MDTLANLFSSIYNAQTRHLSHVRVPYSEKSKILVNILRNEGYIQDFTLEPSNTQSTTKDFTKKKYLSIQLKYSEKTLSPTIKSIRRISKLGKRVYVSVETCWKYTTKKNPGIYILSTSKGILCDRDARTYNLGGELLAHVL